MKKDIQFPEIKNVYVTIIREADHDWNVYLLNRNDHPLETVMVTSKGYGERNGKREETSVLRHMIPLLDAGEYALIEPIHEQVFHLNNEYWVSFFVNGQLYDKKYIFVPDTIIKKNLMYIEELGKDGVLHQ